VSALMNQTSIFRQCLDHNDTSMECSDALKFLVHFIGDITQPLHCSGMSRGGNDIMVKFGNRRRKLHAVSPSKLAPFHLGHRVDGSVFSVGIRIFLIKSSICSILLLSPPGQTNSNPALTNPHKPSSLPPATGSPASIPVTSRIVPSRGPKKAIRLPVPTSMVQSSVRAMIWQERIWMQRLRLLKLKLQKVFLSGRPAS